MNLSWTEFRKKHLFSVNIAVVASFLLWQVRRDFTYHAVILAWLFAGFFVPVLKKAERTLLLNLGKVNGVLLLTFFYFFIFTPFAFIYRWFFRHQSFKRSPSTFVTKDQISDFSRPF